MQVVNPATEEPIAELEQAGVEETDAAVARAKQAFPAWRAVAPIDRARLLRRIATLVEEHGEELALLETRNVGKPIADSRGEVGMVADVFHFYAGAVDKHHGETIPVAGGVDMTFREPLGVVGPCHLGQALTEPTEALVMVRLDRRALAEERADAAAAFQPDVVVGERSGSVLVLLVADHVG